MRDSEIKNKDSPSAIKHTVDRHLLLGNQEEGMEKTLLCQQRLERDRNMQKEK